MSNLRDLVINAHIRHNHPNARIVSWDDADSGLVFYTAEELQKVDTDWFPLCCHLDRESGKAIYGGRSKIVHTYTEGETGAGKTSRFAMQSIRALSSMHTKPSFVVVDIHGELAENLYNHLHSNGYSIKILNCDDPSRSDTYNPFNPLVNRCLETGTLENEVINEIRKIAEIIQPVNDTKDPIWEQGARSYTNGAILDKFEDLLAGKIPPHCITIYNIIQNHYWLRSQLAAHLNIGGLLFLEHYKKKGAGALSIQKMMSVTNNAEKTRASYFGVIENHYDVFGQPTLYMLSSSSTIDINDFIEKPTAIFIQSGATRIGDDLISLLVNEIYSTAVRLGKQSPTKMLPRKIHCFLDEFANSNIADGPEFIKMLTTSRKFGMYWHMLLQCDAQLDRKFDQNMARIIRANCTEIFMGSHDHETMVRFAKSCGQKTVESLGSQVSQQAPLLETVDLITADKLSLTEEGCIYVKSNRHPLLYSYIEAFYHCPEFSPVRDIRSIYPTNDFDYSGTAFFPDDIPPTITDEEFQVLRYLHKKDRKDVYHLDMIFPTLNTTRILHRLKQLDLITDDGTHNRFVSNIGERKFNAIAQCHPEVPEPVIPDLMQKEPPLQNTQSAGKRASSRPSHQQLTDAIKKKLNEQKLTETQIRSTLGRFSCLSTKIADAFCKLSEEHPGSNEDPVDLNPHLLHFELLETFIKNKSFSTKEEWVDAFRYEYGNAVTTPIFPREFTIIFAKALRELSQEMTLGNILEIKKSLTTRKIPDSRNLGSLIFIPCSGWCCNPILLCHSPSSSPIPIPRG